LFWVTSRARSKALRELLAAAMDAYRFAILVLVAG
jgi:hypothetical protein